MLHPISDSIQLHREKCSLYVLSMSTPLHIDRIVPGCWQAPIDSTEAHSIEANIALDHLSHCGLGSAAPGDASLPGRLGRGSDVRLGTADTVPASMNLEFIGPCFLQEVDAFLKKTGIKPQGFGEKAMRGPGFVLRPGRGRSPMFGTDRKMSAWMANTASAVEPGAGLGRGRRHACCGRCGRTHGRKKWTRTPSSYLPRGWRNTWA